MGARKVIFEADTPAGKAFDVLLIVSILISVAVVMLDSIVSLRVPFGRLFYAIEWFFTIVFTVEYGLRLACVGKPLKYASSFYGVVDLLAIIPIRGTEQFGGGGGCAAKIIQKQKKKQMGLNYTSCADPMSLGILNICVKQVTIPPRILPPTSYEKRWCPS